MDDVNCQGSETSLLDCTFKKKDNCGGGDGAGVMCLEKACLYNRKNMEDIASLPPLPPHCPTAGTALLQASYKNDSKCVKNLLETGANVEAKDTLYQRTSFIWFAERADFSVMSTLLEFNASINAIGEKFTALTSAGVDDNVEVTKFLLNQGADPTVLSTSYWNSLHEIIWKYTYDGFRNKTRYNRVPESLKKLVQVYPQHIDSPSKHHMGITPYLLACDTGSQLIMNYLKEVGANTSATLSDGRNCEQLCGTEDIFCPSSSPEAVVKKPEGMCTTKRKFYNKQNLFLKLQYSIKHLIRPSVQI